MSKAKHMAAMQSAILTVSKQTEIMEGAIKLYGATQAKEAETYGALARAALAAILDAQRAKALHLARFIRDPED